MGLPDSAAPVRGAKPAAKSQRRRETVRKWSVPVLKAGFTIVPSVLLTKQDELGLDAVDLGILLHLICHWWKADRLPFPSKKLLSRRLGVDPSTIRRHIAEMERRGMLRRVRRADDGHGQRSNGYDLRPLVDVLHPHAVKASKEREEKKARSSGRRRREP